jgi:hypothetical protein
LTSPDITQSASGLKRKRGGGDPAPAGIPRQPLSATGSKIAYFIAPDKNGNSAAAKHQKKRKELEWADDPVSTPPQKKPRTR